MHRRLTKLLTLWMLPLLVARAIVPVGFMFMADADGLQLMFCPAVSQPADAQMQAHVHAGHDTGHDAHTGVQQMHAAHAGHAHGDGPSTVEHDKTPCPFSLVAALARLDLTYVAVLAALVSERSDSFEILPDVSSDPVQALPIRGPPVLS